jgi:hypothetical protein
MRETNEPFGDRNKREDEPQNVSIGYYIEQVNQIQLN